MSNSKSTVLCDEIDYVIGRLKQNKNLEDFSDDEDQ